MALTNAIVVVDAVPNGEMTVMILQGTAVVTAEEISQPAGHPPADCLAVGRTDWGDCRCRTLPEWVALISVLLLTLAACSGDGNASEHAAAGDPARGEELFVSTCLACHGQGGVGIEGLGKDMTTSEFIIGLSDEELLAFIKVGRFVVRASAHRHTTNLFT